MTTVGATLLGRRNDVPERYDPLEKGLRVEGSGFTLYGLGFKVGVYGLGFRV